MGGAGGGVPEWLKEPAKAVLAALLTAGGLITFVAAVGGAIIWVRYHSAQLPADQALAALPRGELVASGAVMLAAFVILGALAAVTVYLLRDGGDVGGRGVIRGLLVLVTLEALVIIGIDGGAPWERRVVAGEAVVLCALLIPFVVWWREALTLPPDDAPRGATGRVVLAIALSAALVLLALLLADATGRNERPLLFWLVALGAVLAGLVAGLCATWIWRGAADRAPASGDGGDGTARPWWPPPYAPPPPPAAIPPGRERLRRLGVVAIALLTATAATVPALVLAEEWLAVALVTAVALGAVIWRTAERSDYSAFWCGVAVFVSVPLFGAVAGIARNIDDPQVQPVALIRTDDGLAEALQGIYVTETDDRVYLATIATHGCSDRLVPRSGRLVWVPRKEVVTMSLGPSQSVEDAGVQALEMYYALAPKAAVPQLAQNRRAGRAVARRKATAAGVKAAAAAAPPKRRLEDLGPALRRDFEFQQALDPESARPDQEVVLKGSRFDEVDPAERTVRVGGVEAEVVPFPDGRSGWRKKRIRFTVPRGARSGLVTLECGGFVAQPYLRVERAPRVRLDVSLAAGSSRLVFHAGRSKDRDDPKLRRLWEVGGRATGRDKTLESPMRPAADPYEVSLTVTDRDRLSDTAEAVVWRPRVLPVGPRHDAVLDSLRLRLRGDRVKVVVLGHSRIRAKGERDSAKQAKAVWAKLTDGDSELEDKARYRDFGASCLDARGGPPRRVDVLVLPVGARVTWPERCVPLGGG